MGADQSNFDQPIHPQPRPICATEPRFCLPHNVQLHLKEKFFSWSGDDFKIADANNRSIVYFQCEGRAFSISEKKVLRDNVGVAVLNMKEKLFRWESECCCADGGSAKCQNSTSNRRHFRRTAVTLPSIRLQFLVKLRLKFENVSVSQTNSIYSLVKVAIDKFASLAAN